MTTPTTIATLLRLAAAGREEYAIHAPDGQGLILRTEANTLRHAAEVAEGNLEIMRIWMPSWRWQHLPDDGYSQKPVDD